MNTGSLKDVIDSYKAGTIDLTDNGKCKGCGQCCSNILPLSEREIKEINRYIHTHGIKEQRHRMPFANPILYDLTCPFLDIGKKLKCTIYEVRPEICKAFVCNRKDFDKDLIDEARIPVDVRETFFG